MHAAEKFLLSIRHHKLLERADWVWDKLRPVYDRVVTIASKNGLQRVINGTDPILVAPQFRQMGEVYEPDVWPLLMSEIKPGDCIADVGAHMGLYSLAMANRVGPHGRVVAFEPDVNSYSLLQSHITLNHLEDRIQPVQAAVGAGNGAVFFDAAGVTGHVTTIATETSNSVNCVTLDSIFPEQRLDILKIDVEGYEEQVLNGSIRLLSDERRKPRVIYIEVHPYAWPALGTTSDSLLGLLIRHGYEVRTVKAEQVDKLDRYGEVIARDCNFLKKNTFPAR
jgi:FkbM family methyltransferase